MRWPRRRPSWVRRRQISPTSPRSATALVAPINAFFDAVLVMAEDPAVKANRLGLLAGIRDLSEGLVGWEALA